MTGRTLLLTALGVVTVALSTAGAAPAAVHTSASGIAIAQGGAATPYPSAILVAGEGPSLTGLTVTLHSLTHGFAEDVMVVLQGPGGETVRLMSDVGGSGASATDVTLTFDDAAATSLPDTSPLSSGTFRPTAGDGTGIAGDGDPAPAGLLAPGPAGPYGLSLLTAFGGKDPNGTWSLWVLDDTSGDAGSIASWSLNVTAPPVPGVPDMRAADDSGFSGSDNVTNDPTPQFSGATNGATNIRLYADPGTPGNTADDTHIDTPAIVGGSYDSAAGGGNNTVLADGAWNVYARNMDGGVDGPSLAIVIDTVAPGTTTPDLHPDSDTGPSSTDDITADTSPRFTGTTTNGEAARTVVTLIGFTSQSEAGATTAGYDLTFPGPLAPATYGVQATSTDLAGNEGGTTPVLIVEVTGEGCDFAVTRTGTNSRNVFFSDTKARDRWRMLGGNDEANSGHGADCLEGGDGNDDLDGEDGADRLEGGPGADRLAGGDGRDWLVGGSGDDAISAGEGVDPLIDGGTGNDRITSRDGRAETVNCGSGFDRVYPDRQDVLIGCEAGMGDSDG